MWKLLVGFVVFAVIALFVLKKFGGNVDMGGEKHSVETSAPAEAASVPLAASAPMAASVPASAASN